VFEVRDSSTAICMDSHTCKCGCVVVCVVVVGFDDSIRYLCQRSNQHTTNDHPLFWGSGVRDLETQASLDVLFHSSQLAWVIPLRLHFCSARQDDKTTNPKDTGDHG